MEVRALAKNVRLSPSKARDFAGKIMGLPVKEALGLTTHSSRKAAYYLGKTLKSAIANAENNADVTVDNLWVKEAVVDDGPRMKRYWPSARGSASPIKKRLCHMKIVLTDEQKKAKRKR